MAAAVRLQPALPACSCLLLQPGCWALVPALPGSEEKKMRLMLVMVLPVVAYLIPTPSDVLQALTSANTYWMNHNPSDTSNSDCGWERGAYFAYSTLPSPLPPQLSLLRQCDNIIILKPPPL